MVKFYIVHMYTRLCNRWWSSTLFICTHVYVTDGEVLHCSENFVLVHWHGAQLCTVFINNTSIHVPYTDVWFPCWIIASSSVLFVIFCQYFHIFHCYTHYFLLLHSRMFTYALTPSSRVLPEKRTYSQSRNSPHFKEPRGSFPHLQVPPPVAHILTLQLSCRGFMIQ